MRLIHIVLIAGLAGPSSVYAWESGRELSSVVFSSIDTSGNGVLNFGEVTDMAESIAVSVDTNDNKQMNLEEFMAWDFGFAYLAEKDGGGDVFQAVKRVMFAVADLGNDGAIDERDWRLNTRWNFERADIDSNGLLTESEFLNGWTPIVMMKAGKP